MARWTPIVYTNCKRCNRHPCPIARRAERGLVRDEGTVVPVIVRASAAPDPSAAVPVPVHVRPSVPAVRAAQLHRLDVGAALPLLFLGFAALLIAGFESRSR